MQGSNGRYGHYGGRSAPTQQQQQQQQPPNMMFSLSNDISGSAAASAHNPPPPLHYQTTSSLQDPLLYPHHRAQQVGFDQQNQMARRQQATMAQWQVAAASGFEEAASMRQTGFEHTHPFQSQMMALRKGPGFDSDPAPTPQFTHRQLGPESDNTRQELSSQQQRHLGIELGYQTLSSQMQSQKPPPLQRNLGFDPDSYQTTTPQLGFEPPSNEDENACQQARTVHQQLGFESDSPESSSSDDGPSSPIAPPPPTLNPAPAPPTQDTNKQAEIDDNENDDENDNENDNDHDGAAAAAHNRWPKKETMALLKARAEMDALFRDIGPKWPLWEEISRKLAEMGCKRSAKKCKEKFENVLKYYKKTKEGKAMRPERKNYRFFNQLEAIFGSGSSAFMGVGGGSTPTPILTPAAAVRGINKSMIMQGINNNQLCGSSVGVATGRLLMDETGGANKPSEMEDCGSPFNFSSESSGDDEDGEEEDDGSGGEGGQEKKRKRKSSSSTKKVLCFFEHLMKKVTQKQDQLHQKLLQALERRESDRMHREQAWRRQEMARLGQELELRSQERALASTRDAALVSFLQQATGRSFEGIVAPTPISTSSPLRVNPIASDEPLLNNTTMTPSLLDPKNKRWPKPEVLALIKFRSALEPKFRDPGPKGRVWKQVSREMASLGFTRSARRCREKWENINKYFLRTRESNKQRSENSKTCPYFSQLDALYRKGVLGCPPPPPQKTTAATAVEKSCEDVSLATEANATTGDGNADSNAPHFPNPNNASGIGG